MPKEISTIIFSKNRACQLELLLRSLNIPAQILYTCDPVFESGYDKLIKMYPTIDFVRETDFRSQLIEFLEKNSEEYVLFLVDDDVMIEPWAGNCPEFQEFKRNLEIISLSLRLAPDYQGAPVIKNNTWNWQGLKHDWGYPMSVSAHIFRKSDILPILVARIFSMPNDLEIVLRTYPPAKPLMICLNKPNFINVPVNLVQNKYRNRNMGIPAEEINKKFLAGYRISLEDIIKKAKSSKSCFLRTNYEYEIY